ncbi:MULTISPECIES: FliM/FliN family flagellar motor switch protein [Jannaschia]|nr:MULTISPECIES: FliM/FliN family flagellar motor C-terminal domain-containing protein [unclassified Jannaschia]
MPTDSSSSILRQLAGLPAPETPAETPGSPALERAMTTAALRVADAVPALGLSVRARASTIASAEAAFDGLPDQALCLMVDPPLIQNQASASSDHRAATTGTLVLDSGLIDSLIEVQTIGRIDGPARPGRRPTRIDAALVQPFAQEWVDQIGALLPRDHYGARPGRLRTGTFLAGPGSLPMVLTASSYLRIEVSLSLANGDREAKGILILPDIGPEVSDDSGDALPSVDPAWTAQMTAVAQAAPVRLDALLPKIRVSLADLVALKPGDVIDLEPSALDDLSLVSGSSGLGRPGRRRMPHGVTLRGKLGQLNGERAIRIIEGPNDPPLTDTAEMTALPSMGGQASAAVPMATGTPSVGTPEVLGAAAIQDPLQALTQEAKALATHPQPALGVEDAAAPLPSLDDLPPLPELPELP